MVVAPLAVCVGAKVPQATPVAMKQLQVTPALAASLDTVAPKATVAPVAMDCCMGKWVIATDNVPALRATLALTLLVGSETEVAVMTTKGPVTLAGAV
jgi:hypothetical protein